MTPRIRRLGNCLTFAAMMWVGSHAKDMLWMRRSSGLRGYVPHFGMARERANGRRLILVETIPPKRKERWLEDGNTFVAFPMIYRVRTYVLASMGTGDSLREAVRSQWHTINVCPNCGEYLKRR